jgi:hypothetical protein
MPRNMFENSTQTQYNAQKEGMKKGVETCVS